MYVQILTTIIIIVTQQEIRDYNVIVAMEIILLEIVE